MAARLGLVAAMLVACSRAESSTDVMKVPSSTDAEIVEGYMRGSVNSTRGLAEAMGSACHGQAGWNRNLYGALLECAKRTGGANPAAGGCMAASQGVSKACGACMGQSIECGRDHCSLDCCSGQCSSSSACVRCSQKNCNWKFSACAGVDLSDAMGTACVGQAGWNLNFSANLLHCAMRTGGANPAAGACMAKSQAVSKDCGFCMGQLIESGRDNCLMICCLGQCNTSPDCVRCNQEKCYPKFKACAGVDI